MNESTKVANIVEVSFRRSLTARIFDRISTWNDQRVATAQLNAMSDRLLKDIGINRYQIEQAVKRPADFAELSTIKVVSPEVSSDIQRAA